MTQTLKLELPLDPQMLRETARMLDNVADGLSGPMLPGIHEETTFTRLGGEEEVVVTTIPDIPNPTPEEDTIPTPSPEIDVVPTPTPEVDTIPTPEGVAVDCRGIVWDKRIHAGTKALNVDNTWRNKRGVDKDLLAQVEAELLGNVAEAPAPTAPAVEAPTPAPTAPVAATTTEKVVITTFGELMAELTKAGKTPEETQAACLKAGVQSVALLAARADLVPTVAAELGL